MSNIIISDSEPRIKLKTSKLFVKHKNTSKQTPRQIYPIKDYNKQHYKTYNRYTHNPPTLVQSKTHGPGLH